MDAQVETQDEYSNRINTLVTSDSSFVAKSDDETGQDVRNNCSENSSVKGDAQVEY